MRFYMIFVSICVLYYQVFAQPLPQYNTPLAGRNLELETKLRLELQNAIMARGGAPSLSSMSALGNQQFSADDAQFLYLMTQSPQALLHSQISIPSMQSSLIRPFLANSQLQNPTLSQLMMNSPYPLNNLNSYPLIQSPMNLYGYGYGFSPFGYGLNSPMTPFNSFNSFNSFYRGLPLKR